MESIYESASRSSQVVCAEFRGAFQLFDRNKDGFISCKELSVVVDVEVEQDVVVVVVWCGGGG